MAQAYTPGLKAQRRVRHRSRRFLPLTGEVLVEIGQTVAATDVMARTLLPGPVVPVNVAQLLSIPTAELQQSMRISVGDAVASGALLARSNGIFGWFPSECMSPAAGTVEAISNLTGQVLIRGAPQAVEIKAYLAGTVVEVVPQQGATVEAEVTLIQGIFGIGSEAYGPIRLACQKPADALTAERITPELRGAVAIGGGRVVPQALSRAVEMGVAAIVTGGIDDQDLRDFLGYDLGVATTGSERVGLTLIITEGFGDIAMARQTFDLLASRAGADAAVNGATQIRAGVVRPEIVIPWTDGDVLSTEHSVPGTQRPAFGVVGNTNGAGDQSESGSSLGLLRPGATVRIIRDPYFGMLGTVSALPPEPQVLGSGSKARVLEVRLDAGERVVVPRANVELVEQ
jgi:hypothetical protein